MKTTIENLLIQSRALDRLMDSATDADLVRKIIPLANILKTHLEVFTALETKISKLIPMAKLGDAVKNGYLYSMLDAIIADAPASEDAVVVEARIQASKLAESITKELESTVEFSITPIPYSSFEKLGISASVIRRLGELVTL